MESGFTGVSDICIWRLGCIPPILLDIKNGWLTRVAQNKPCVYNSPWKVDMEGVQSSFYPSSTSTLPLFMYSISTLLYILFMYSTSTLLLFMYSTSTLLYILFMYSTSTLLLCMYSTSTLLLFMYSTSTLLYIYILFMYNTSTLLLFMYSTSTYYCWCTVHQLYYCLYTVHQLLALFVWLKLPSLFIN